MLFSKCVQPTAIFGYMHACIHHASSVQRRVLVSPKGFEFVAHSSIATSMAMCMASPAVDSAEFTPITIETTVNIKGGYSKRPWTPAPEDMVYTHGQTFVRLQCKDHGLKRLLTGDGTSIWGTMRGMARLQAIRMAKMQADDAHAESPLFKMLGAVPRKRKHTEDTSGYELMKLSLPAFEFNGEDVGALQITVPRPKDGRAPLILPMESSVISYVVRFVQSHGYNEVGRTYQRSPLDLPAFAHWTKRSHHRNPQRDGVTLSYLHPVSGKTKTKLFIHDEGDEDMIYTSKL